MSLTNERAPEAIPGVTAPRRAPGTPLQRMLLWGVLLLVIFSTVRVLTGANDLTSSGTFGAALGLGVPIGLAGLGGLWCERAGVVNIGLEGMMILGTFGAGWIGWQHGPYAGVLAAIAFGMVGGLVHAVATVTFGVDHIVSGVAINILGLGATKYLASILLDGTPGGGQTQSPPTDPLPTVGIPFIRDPLGSLEKTGWFLVGDVAGILRGLLTRVSLLTVVALLLFVATYYVLWRTPFGLRLRSCGEDPYAAESLGVNVYLYKYIAVVTSGGLAGLGGAFLAIVAAPIYREGQTSGRGYIGLAAMIFGNWRPGGLLAGAGLFGFTDAMQLRSEGAVHALLLLVAIGLAVLAVVAAMRRSVIQAGIAALVGAGFAVWFFASDKVPGQFTTMTPYVTTLLVLSLASQSLRMPKADGLVYRRGGGK